MAEETFKQIVEVEVNNDDAIQAVVEQQKAIDGLRSTISDLKKQQKELDTTTKEGVLFIKFTTQSISTFALSIINCIINSVDLSSSSQYCHAARHYSL